MKTLKKLFSVSAIVALLGTLAPMYAFGAGNSLDLDPEFPAAYAYAYANGITTQSEDNADMGGKLTRIALAKMIAKYAINVLKLTPDTSKTCNFTDVTAALDAQYDNGVTQACQLGLMGVNITAFRPNDLVTRGEFGTTFSRALNANSDNLAAMNAADPYYKEHLNYLNKEGIMKVIDPNMLEVRGYVMLMMMRSDESYTAVEGCTAEELLACFNADDYDACIAACSDEEPAEEEEEIVKNGTLTVSVSNRSSDVVSAPKKGTIILNSISFKASEAITVDTLTLKAAGLTNNQAVDKVWFEKDGARVSSKAGLTSDGTATVNFTKGLTVKSNEKLDLVASINGNVGSQITLELDSVTSSAEKNNISGKTTTYSLIEYKVAGLKYTIKDVSTTIQVYKLGEQDEILFTKVDLENDSDDKAIDVKSITFNTNNTNVEKVLQNFTLIRDGKNVAKSITFDGKKVTVTLDDSIEASKTAKYSLYAEVKALDNGDEDFYFDFDKDDIVAYEEGNNFRTTNTDNGSVNPSCTDPQNCVRVAGGKIVLTNDSDFATTVNANAGYSDVQIAQGTLTVAEPVHFEKLVLKDDVTAEADADDVKSLKLEIGGKTYNATITRATTDPWKNIYTFEDIYVNKTSSVKLYVSFANTVTLSSLVIAGNNIQNIMFKNQAGGDTNVGDYQNNSVSFDNGDIAGSIKVATVSIKDTKFTLKNNLSSTVKVVKGDSKSVVLFDGNATSTKGDVELTEIKVNSVDMGSDYADLTLKVNGRTISTKKYTDAEISFPINNVVVGSEPVSVVLEAIPHTTATNTYTFKLAAEGTINGNTATADAVSATPLQIVANSSLVISSINQPNQVKLEGNDVEIMKFDVTAQYGNVDLSTFKVATNTKGLTPSLLIDDGTTVVLSTVSCTTDGANETDCEKDSVAAKAETAAYANGDACTAAKPDNTATWTFACNEAYKVVATQVTPAELALSTNLNLGGKTFTVTTAGHVKGVWGVYSAADIDETLDSGKHSFKVTANVRDSETGLKKGVNVKTTKVVVNTTEKDMATDTLFVKVMPEITATKDGNVLTVKVKNTSTDVITLNGLAGNATASTYTVVVNGQDAGTLGDMHDITAVTLAEGDEATIEITVGSAGTAKLTGIRYYVEDGAYEYTYSVVNTYQTYPWGTFQVTYSA